MMETILNIHLQSVLSIAYIFFFCQSSQFLIHWLQFSTSIFAELLGCIFQQLLATTEILENTFYTVM